MIRPFIEKLHLDDNSSFYAAEHRTPKFEVPWHQHIELEIIYFREGFGTAYIGNYVGEFKAGDVFFLGSNLPHTFQKSGKKQVVSAIVVQFEENFLGDHFLQLPETKELKELFHLSLKGIQFTSTARVKLGELVNRLVGVHGLSKIILLCECLEMMLSEKKPHTVSTQEVAGFHTRKKERIDKIYQFTIEHFSEPIQLGQVAEMASMTVPAFCSYFKKSTKKTYIEFLNEVRVSNACKLLSDTQLPVSEICYESGFNTLANFNKQFLKIKKRTPSAYRKIFSDRPNIYTD